jgi:hypothetical protein
MFSFSGLLLLSRFPLCSYGRILEFTYNKILLFTQIISMSLPRFLLMAVRPVSWPWPPLPSSLSHSNVLPLPAIFSYWAFWRRPFALRLPSIPRFSDWPYLSEAFFRDSFWDSFVKHSYFMPSRGSVRSTRGLGPTMTARGPSIDISIGMLPQTLIMSITVQKTSKYYTTEFDLEEGI